MTPIVGLLAMLWGTIGLVLGVAMLLAQHRGSPLIQRFSIGLMAFLCLLTAINGFSSLRTFMTFDDQPSPVSVAFAAALALNWALRLRRGR